jgi:uncharacterized protein (TIGR02757 family)
MSDLQRITAHLAGPLNELYERYNRPEFIYPDPLAPVLAFPHAEDREIAGLIAASLAFGNVKQILRGIGEVFTRLPQPHACLASSARRDLDRAFRGYRYRFVDGGDMVDLLWGMNRMIATHQTLGRGFSAQIEPGDETLLPALIRWVDLLRAGAQRPNNYLLPDPRRGSACKRLWLYLRWMVRSDAVDPGAWPGIPPRLLITPLDTHAHRIISRLGLTARKTADLRTALEATAAFRCIAPEDPVRYDFALTRMGIRNDGDPGAFFHACRC